MQWFGKRPCTAATAVLVVVVLMTGCTSAEPGPTESPSTFESATQPLKDLARHAAGEGAPAVVLDVQDGARETAEALGVRDRISKTPAEATDRLWISGLGTSMLAVSVMKLVEENRIGLDDRTADLLPEFSAIFPAWSGTTVRELLGSRTGLPDYVPPLVASMPLEQLQITELTFEERLRLAASVGAGSGPVSELVWSATDWEVLAWLVERLRGKSLAEVLREDVFEPAGMTSSLLAGPGQPPEPMLHGYVQAKDLLTDVTRLDAFAGSGDTGIISSAVDVNRFFVALTTGRLVSPKTWQQMSGSNPYDLGTNTTEDICPGTKHVVVYGGGGPYAIGSIATTDGRQQVTAAMVLPPAPLDTTRVPALVLQLEQALRATAAALCS